MPRKKQTTLLPAERIERAILLAHGQKVMLDRDLEVTYCGFQPGGEDWLATSAGKPWKVISRPLEVAYGVLGISDF